MTGETIFCNRCGRQSQAGAAICGNCGAQLTPQAVAAASFPGAGFPGPVIVPVRSAYAGFWLRVLAAILDTIIVQAVVTPVVILIVVVVRLAGAAVAMPGAAIHLVGAIASGTLGFGSSWLYEALMESSSRQATLGKMALSLKVTDLGGQRISFLRATGRHFAKLVSIATLCIGYLMAGFTSRKQALQDFIAGTLVIRG